MSYIHWHTTHATCCSSAIANAIAIPVASLALLRRGVFASSVGNFGLLIILSGFSSESSGSGILLLPV